MRFILGFVLLALQLVEGARVTLVSRRWPNATREGQLLRLEGTGLTRDTWIAFTTLRSTRGRTCDDGTFLNRIFRVSDTGPEGRWAEVPVKLPPVQDMDALYLCVLETDAGQPMPWIHQGSKVKLNGSPVNGKTSTMVLGLRAEGDKVYLSEEGVTSIPADQATTLRLFGTDFSSRTLVAFTVIPAGSGSDCDDLPKTAVMVAESSGTGILTLPNLLLPEISGQQAYHLCAKQKRGSPWIHQGQEPWLKVRSEGRLIPKWLQVGIIIFLQIMSGLFSGLNLGLMALDNTELQIIARCGTEREKAYARTISPLRRRGNYLLCSIVLGNVLVNSVLTVLLDDLTSGLVAIIGSTIGIVIFGEIIPQAICSRHGLAVGANTVFVTKLFMVLTFPMSFPISKILDWVLGEEIVNVYDREKLQAYVKLTRDFSDLKKEEVNIISGALQLAQKRATDIMTPVQDVFMIPYDAALNFETMTEIIRKGYTRVPVFQDHQDNIVGLLHTRDLALVDPDDNTPVKTLCQFYNHPIIFVFDDERLDVLLNEFKKGKSHMACVRHVDSQGSGDPYYEIIGVVTLEDVIEEILQSEIVDETDVLTDNRLKQPRPDVVLQDYSEFVKIGNGGGKCAVSPQLALATYQYLSTSVEPFRKDLVSEVVLRRLLTQKVFVNHRHSETTAAPLILFKKGKAADYFLLVLEGRVRVTVGQEQLMYEAGPFSYFGVQALALTPILNGFPTIQQVDTLAHTSGFLPDYTVISVGDLICMKISRASYITALRTTMVERTLLTVPDNQLLKRRSHSDTCLGSDNFHLPSPATSI